MISFLYNIVVTYILPRTGGSHEKGGQLMEKEKRTYVDWIREHKTQLIIAGVSTAAIIAAIIGIENHKVLEETWASFRKLVEKKPDVISVDNMVSVTGVLPVKDIVATGKIPHNVVEHLRNLPEGWKASAEKIATAAEHGYDLLPGQTWVEAYRTGKLAA